MRWPDHVAAGVDNRLTALVDLAPTIREAVGLSEEGDGHSLLSGASRDRLLLEHWAGGMPYVPTWASLRTHDYQFIEYYDETGTVMFREYYDLANDPWQLVNLFGDSDPSNDPDIQALSENLAADRNCAGVTCP